jgi:L-lactate dehydrogenase complex protein LldG
MEREVLLARVRAATGGPAPATSPVMPHGAASPPRLLGGPDAVAQLAGWWERPHRSWHRVASADAAAAVAAILGRGHHQRVALSAHPLLRALGIAEAVSAVAEILPISRERASLHRTLASADAGITAADYAVAETGTLVERAGAEQPRGISLLPPVHIALVRTAVVLTRLDDLFATLAPEPIASGVVFISGPSGTADIGLQHVTGVHGPREVHLIVVDGSP